MKTTWLTETFGIKLPMILAPMFLVSNTKMLIAAAQSGFMGTIPSLNFKTDIELENALKELKDHCPGPYGINLITNESNLHYKKHLELLKKYPPAFVMTSLGTPKECIQTLKPLGVKILCDVVDVNYAKKVEELGADALIAVNNGAGGHLGNIPASILIPMLKRHCSIPVISAGGVGSGQGLFAMLSLGADGISIGSPFIASKECEVNADYKKAIINYGAKDIVTTTKISGSRCTVINTPYVQKIGTEQNPLEKFLNSNRKVKKYVKALTFYRGMKALEKAAFSATYNSVWCAGASIEFVEKEMSIQEFVEKIAREYQEAKKIMLK